MTTAKSPSLTRSRTQHNLKLRQRRSGEFQQAAGHSQVRGGTGYARARELLDGGAALRQMQKIIDAQGPSTSRAELGTLTLDVAADKVGMVESIDCLRLNRLARLAGAPIYKSAGIMVLKKIGDQIERGEPLYRLYACEHSEFELASAAANARCGYRIGDRPPAS